MTIPGLGLSGRSLLGAGAGAALLALYGGRRRDPEEVMDHAAVGAGLGFGVAAAAPALWWGAKTFAPNVGKSTLGHFTGMPGNYAGLRSAGLNMPSAAWESFGTLPTLGLAGAGIGFAMGGPKGAMLGLAAGVGSRYAVQGAKWYGRQNPFLKTAGVLAVSASMIMHGAFNVSDPLDTQEATTNPVTQEMESHPEGTFQKEYGVGYRMQQMQAKGDIVFGLHNNRH